MSAATEDAPSGPTTRVLKSILYCSICSYPPELCEWGGSLEKCKAWLRDSHPDTFEKLYGEVPSVTEKLASASISPPEAGAAGSSSSDPAPEAKLSKSQRKKQQSQRVVIELSARSKRKHVTSITGLENYDVDLKKAAKMFATKFACGASVTKTPDGRDEIVVQGEFADEISELIQTTWPQVDDDKITMKEKKTKGGGGGGGD
ncbi:density-regulated protein DRP1 [Gonapodya prolifera JEL478]|uniref:Translation machinery-associated protein 22 n=1 Tax=Gonapodya prolifera (strain JEL478) TaxID=1344416 RepID=A0A139AAK7_GONPJ|nr:density-regulated protein DRP1 [Gonapodya prolifera JEL478]|eukprot:KXS13694.1 density-regulated protein DRP1 [Gonapodya prolifera JEL478]